MPSLFQSYHTTGYLSLQRYLLGETHSIADVREQLLWLVIRVVIVRRSLCWYRHVLYTMVGVQHDSAILLLHWMLCRSYCTEMCSRFVYTKDALRPHPYGVVG